MRALSDSDQREQLGRHLGRIRQERKISQDEAARAVKMSRPHLSNIEQGRSRLGWDGLKKLAAFYDVNDLNALAQEPLPLPPAMTTKPQPANTARQLLDLLKRQCEAMAALCGVLSDRVR